jgi:anti-sigma regulatory factor (Ser/Thr protein kinase)
VQFDDARMSDHISLTIPAASRYRGVATLVLGGIGSRLDLPYERVDDLQLAVVSLLEASEGDAVTVEVESKDEAVRVSVGPLTEGSASDAALARVLTPLVDSVEPVTREQGTWLTLSLRR